MTTPDYFSSRIAADYDRDVAESFQPHVLEPMIKMLSTLARGGPCLEFAIGTGRVALALQSVGLKVDGIELSHDMIVEIKKKPGAQALEVRQGDMATLEMGRNYPLVYLVFNTVMNLTTQKAQVQCFRNAAKHLRSGGRFVVEVMVPALRHLPPSAVAVPFDVSQKHIGLDTYVISEQRLTSHHVTLTADGTATYNSIPFRYVWPSELDLMAELAGMRLVQRHGDWIGTPFDDDSRNHVSVWEKS